MVKENAADAFRRRRRRKEIGLFFARLLFIAALFAMLYAARLLRPGAREETALSGLSVDLGEGERVSLDIPAYRDQAYYILHDDIPFFDPETAPFKGESYSDLDALGRCGPARALLDPSMMTEEARENMKGVRPSGWQQVRYKGIIDADPPFLYHRCHLIAYTLTGQNANERNLITGTRYFNVNGMLPFERQVMDYIWDTGYRVLYRVTPVFEGKDLLCHGVIMEAWSVEDRGKGICFNVYVYNVQPGITLNYADGSSQADKNKEEEKKLE